MIVICVGSAEKERVTPSGGISNGLLTIRDLDSAGREDNPPISDLLAYHGQPRA